MRGASFARHHTIARKSPYQYNLIGQIQVAYLAERTGYVQSFVDAFVAQRCYMVSKSLSESVSQQPITGVQYHTQPLEQLNHLNNACASTEHAPTKTMTEACNKPPGRLFPRHRPLLRRRWHRSCGPLDLPSTEQLKALAAWLRCSKSLSERWFSKP